MTQGWKLALKQNRKQKPHLGKIKLKKEKPHLLHLLGKIKLKKEILRLRSSRKSRILLKRSAHKRLLPF